MEHAEPRRVHSTLKSYAYPLLRKNPHYGRYVRKLKDEFKDIYRYRISDYQIFYIIDEQNKVVFMLVFHHRKDAYR